MRISDWSSDVCSSDLFAESLGEGRVLGGGQRPEAEGAVDVNPGAGAPRPLDDLGSRIEAARVHVAGLDADDGGAGDGGQSVGAQAPLPVRLDPPHPLAP